MVYCGGDGVNSTDDDDGRRVGVVGWGTGDDGNGNGVCCSTV